MLFTPWKYIFYADADAADSNADDTNDIQAAADYGVPSHLLFQPDDLAVQAHVYK